MPGLSIGHAGSRTGLSATAGTRLADIFGDKWSTVEILILQAAKDNKVPVEVLYTVLYAEVKPVDWKKWPHTWLGTTRVNTYLSSLKPMHWEAMRQTTSHQVLATIEEWNAWRAHPVGKMGRLVGRSVSVKKVYWMGSKLKDMWVVAHFVYNKGLTLSNQFTQFVKIVRDAKEIAPYLWNWVKQDKVDVTASSQGKYSMLEVGE